MSEDWPSGWYRDEPRRPGAGSGGAPGYGGSSYTPGGDASGSPYDRTQVVPQRGSAWPAQPPVRTRPGTDWQPVRPRRRWLRPRRLLALLGVLVVLLAAATAGLYFYLNSKLTRVNVLVPTSLTSAGTNWLITGSDSRGGLTTQQENQLALGRNITGQRSDTIMVLHLPSNGTRPTLVSIPRDSYVPIPGYGSNKVNAAFAFGGPQLLIRTVQDVTGLRIDHYMGIGFGGLVSVVNDVGGVTMCLPQPIQDPKAGLNLKAGCQTLNGAQALGFVRTREFANGDLQREQDQRVLLKSLLSKMTSAGTLVNPFAVIPAADGSASALTVDQGTSLSQLVSVAFALRNPVTTMVPFGGFANTAAGSVVLWNTQQARQFFSDLAQDKALPKSLITGSAVQA
ncbi:MAG: LCP family protein [Streptosporangiaceae bacterium]|nr:LCP family protein [Streptosporangiaceae bacterium]